MPSYLKGWSLIIVCLLNAKDSHIVFLDGTIAPILKLSQSQTLDLNSEANVARYLQFHCAAVYYEGRNSVIIQHQEEVNWCEGADPKEKQAVADNIKPLTMKRETERSWIATGTVLHGKEFSSETFTVYSDGRVLRKDAKILLKDLPVVLDKFCSSLRLPILTDIQKAALSKQRLEKAEARTANEVGGARDRTKGAGQTAATTNSGSYNIG